MRNAFMCRKHRWSMVVCICGNINEDIILGIDAFPAFHEKRRAEALTRSFGGSGANTCWWLSSLGTPARMMGCVGRDSAGIGALSALRDAGADIQHVIESAKATGLAVVLSCGQDKRMVKYTGANEDIALDGGEMEGCTHCTSLGAAARGGSGDRQHARARGATVSWDPSELFFPRTPRWRGHPFHERGRLSAAGARSGSLRRREDSRHAQRRGMPHHRNRARSDHRRAAGRQHRGGRRLCRRVCPRVDTGTGATPLRRPCRRLFGTCHRRVWGEGGIHVGPGHRNAGTDT